MTTQFNITGLLWFLLAWPLWPSPIRLATDHAAASPLQTESPPALWTNSLGMVFVSIPGTQVQYSIWETRVRDFEAFVKATGYEPGTELKIVGDNRTMRKNWRQPGFAQEPTHPVVMVSWEDANRYCAWLTAMERATGGSGTSRLYRLPSDAEWSTAAGPNKYFWNAHARPSTNIPSQRTLLPRTGDDRTFFPPPPMIGNYAGQEALNPERPEFKALKDYRDGYAHTAPVGSFTPNRHGLYDLGGNVWEWCDDWYRKEMNSAELEQKLPFQNHDGDGRTYRVLRGASFNDSHPAILRSDCRSFDFPDRRSDHVGFRVVLAPSSR